MPRTLCVLIAMLFVTGGVVAADAPSIIAPGAELQKVSSDFKFTEGPASDKEGNVYFTDQPNDRILKWNAADGKIETFLQPCGRSNGMCVDHTGTKLIACADEKNEMWSIDLATKAVTVLFKDYQGKLLNGPNDVWVHPSGAMYFSDPLYKRDWWKRDPKMQQEMQAVYWASADGKTIKRVADDLEQPNGLIGTPDGKTLYVTDIKAKKTYSYAIKEDGSLADKKLFCAEGSDGMTIDNQGNVYFTNAGTGPDGKRSGRVPVYDKSGKLITQIFTPGEGWAANICFGGKDKDVLFITASKSVFTLKMAVKGAGSQ